MRSLLGYGISALIALAVPLIVIFAIAQWQAPLRPGMLAGASGVDLTAAEDLFQKNCTHCHRLDVAGGDGRGPNLGAIGRTASARKPGTDAIDYILESITDPAAFQVRRFDGVMPRTIASKFSADEIRGLVALLASQGGADVDMSRVARLGIPEPKKAAEPRVVSRKEVERGQALYFEKGQCAACHTLLPGLQFSTLKAPSLSGARYHDEEYLLESIRHPSRVIVPGYRTTNIGLKQGEMLSGRLLREQEQTITLLTFDIQGNSSVVEVPRSQIETFEDGTPMIEHTNVSPMPDRLGDVLSDEEVACILAFLKSLN